LKGALTLPKIRTLVRLYRSQVEGASEQLEALMREQWDELHPLLRVTPSEIVRMGERENAVQALARAVEEASTDTAESRSLALRKTARLAAATLARASVVVGGGAYRLPAKGLRELLDLWRGSGDVAFGGRGAVDVVRLRALLRQCEGLDSTTITLTEHHLVIAYSTTRARGVIRFVLRARHHGDKLLAVPLPEPGVATRAELTIHSQPPWPADDAQDAASPQAPLPPRRPVLVLVR
jgi:hypothetical protein